MSRRSGRGAAATPVVEKKPKVQYPDKTVHCDIESPLNAVSTCSDGSRVVVAGRNVFKVLSIDPEGFHEDHNLRCGRVNLNFSHTDVQWNPSDDSMMATAATNGAVVLWDLQRLSKNKQLHVFNDHHRTVNKVCFHSDGNSLFSGSQDGTIKSFDSRQPKVTHTFDCKTESVRDIQVSPHVGHQFAAALENGCVQLWDTRNPAQYESFITAHQGPVFACDWHPEERHWLATAGRDKVIKVWDLRDRPGVRDVHSLHTIASVARIKWRPDHPFELASCALLLDFNIHVWDVRRPYIPFASFPEHKDVTTGVVWQKDSNYLLSGAKDNFLYLHRVDDALRPAESAPPLGLALGCHGHISFAVSDEISRTKFSKPPIPPPPPQRSSYTQPAFFRHLTPAQIAAPSVASDLMMYVRQVPQALSEVSELDWVDIFKVLAKGYKLNGMSPTQLFDYNQELAQSCGRLQEGQVWQILSTLYAPLDMPINTGGASSQLNSSTSEFLSSGAPAPVAPSPGPGAAAAPAATSSGAGAPAGGGGGASSTAAGGRVMAASPDHLSQSGPTNMTSPAPTADEASTLSDGGRDRSHSSSSHSDQEDNTSLAGSDGGLGTPDMDELNRIASGGYLDEGNDELGFGFADSLPGEDALQNLELPSEAFQPRYDLDDAGSPSYLSESEDGPKDDLTVSTLSVPVPGGAPTPTLSALNEPQGVETFDFSPVICDMLEFYAHQGNVQMTVSVLLVLGEKGKDLIDPDIQEQWYLAYIDLLSRFKLYTVKAQVIKLCPLKAVHMLNLDSTTVATQCGMCSKSVMQKGSYCDRCHFIASTCGVCHQPVRGLYVWCQGCGHGGHVDHITDWFSQCNWCPEGCGHKCEFL